MAEKRTASRLEPHRRRIAAGLVAIVLLALLAGVVGAQSSGEYDLSWYSLDSGSGALAGARFGLAGTVGESLPGLATGMQFGLAGGFDPGVAGRAAYQIYLPTVLRGQD